MTQADLDADWSLFCFVRQVEYLPYEGSTDRAATSGPTVDAFPVNLRAAGEASEGGEVPVTRRVWHLRASQLGAVEVTQRGVIQEADGTRWLVESCEAQTNGTRIRCQCHRL